MDLLDNYPKRDRNSSVERKAEVAFEAMLADLDGLFEQHRAHRDYGTDYELEVTSGESVTNVRLHVQLKGTEKDLNADGSVSVTVSLANVNYLMMQPYSFYVCYHVPTKSLRVRSTESVIMSYARLGENWTDQKTITVTFSDVVTPGFLASVAKLALLRAIGARGARHRQLSVAPDDLPKILRRQRAVVHVPDDAHAAGERVRELFEAGMDEALSEAFDRFAVVLGESSEAMIFCYMAEINLGMTGGRPDTGRIETALAFLTGHLDLGQFEPGGLHYCIGNALGVLARYEAAVAAYERALGLLDASNGAHPVAQCLKNLGSSLERLGDIDLAVARYRQALHLRPNLSEAHAALGSHHHRRGEFDDALSHFDLALFSEGAPALESVAGWRINVLFNLKDGRAAFRDINALTGRAIPAEWVWPWCANQVAAFGRASVENALQAAGFWEKYLGICPDNADGLRERLLCRLYLRQQGRVIGKYSAVKAEVEQCIGLLEQEVSALLWDRLGHWAQDESDWIEAEGCFRRAFDIDGGHYGYCLGTALNFLGRCEESLPLLREQAESVQPDAMSWHQLAMAHDRLGQLGEAIVAFRRAVDLDPDYGDAWFNLGGAHWNNGEVAQAMLVWKEAIERHPDHSLALELRGRFPGVLT